MEPMIIQGGMGVAVSDWKLARAVSLTGQLGVVSGTAIDVVLARRLQQGDPGGHMQRALAEFPYPEMAARVKERFFIEGGKPTNTPYKSTMILPVEPTQEQLELVVVSNFVEVYLAKEGHTGWVGINYLEKIQTPTLPSLFGAMLAGVDYVLMGAGIPRAIPGILDRLVDGEAVELPLAVSGATSEDNFVAKFDPMLFTAGQIPWLERPKFLPIVASATLASVLARKSNGRIQGLIVEGPTAGGHNAPPRGAGQCNARGEPVYGERDRVDLAAIGQLGLPFWLAGSYGGPEQVQAALDVGATGVQVGTAFAFCRESGIDSRLKQQVLELCRSGRADVFTDPLASPTGFPFKVLQMQGTLSDSALQEQRQRVCDLGFLRQAYRRSDGAVGWRCPGEKVAAYLQKGGEIADTVGRKCVCNGLLANVGQGQIRRHGEQEKPLLTCGNDVNNIVHFLASGATSYSAAQVVERLLAGIPSVV
ncbi:MAG: nitronate monooxygenase [Planctomycetales bacterium]|nr:nitronate monooxygenase [Planctomycetales bacterium]